MKTLLLLTLLVAGNVSAQDLTLEEKIALIKKYNPVIFVCYDVKGQPIGLCSYTERIQEFEGHRIAVLYAPTIGD